MRVLSLLLLVPIAGCQCLPVTQPVVGALRVDAQTLEFGEVPLQAHTSRALELTGLTRAPVEGVALTAPPFTAPASFTVPGGETLPLTVTFAPETLGPVTSTLVVTAAGAEFRISLHGTGVPACVSEPCQQSTFNPETGRCEVINAADDQQCAAPCVVDGRCHQGTCVGVAATCEDHDACTVDACGGTECVHVPRVCAVEDPCRVAFCDPATGCSARDVDDGTPCGPATCATASICMSGRCTQRTRPNADQDCLYVELVSGGYHFCGRTRGGGVRCWGNNDADQGGRGYAAATMAPGFISGHTDVSSVAANPYSTCTASPVHGMRCVGLAPLAPRPGTRVAYSGEYRACVEWGGQTDCWSTSAMDAGLTPLARAPEPWCQGALEACVITDGGVRCAMHDVLTTVQGLPPNPVSITCGDSALPASRGGGACARYANGSVWCWRWEEAPVELWDGGVQVVGQQATGHAQNGYVTCAFGAGGTECIRGEPAPRDRVPWTDVAQFALGILTQCALRTDGTVSCLGRNYSGGLGDRSAQPLGPQLWPTRAAAVDLSFSAIVVADGGMAYLDSVVVTDGGFQWQQQRVVRVDGGVGQAVGGRMTNFGYRPCWLDAERRLWCENGGALTVEREGVRKLIREDLRQCLVADAGLECWTWPRWLPVATGVDPLDLGRGTDGCFTVADGGWWCLPGHRTPWWADQPTADACGTCAISTTGAVRCLDGGVAAAVPGAWFAARGITCGSGHTCWWGALNGVQCVGDNRRGQLGRDGPSSTSAVSIPMDEPVVSVAASWDSTCAVLASGKVKCWGDNTFGQLGPPYLVESAEPVDVTQ